MGLKGIACIVMNKLFMTKLTKFVKNKRNEMGNYPTFFFLSIFSQIGHFIILNEIYPQSGHSYFVFCLEF